MIFVQLTEHTQYRIVNELTEKAEMFTVTNHYY